MKLMQQNPAQESIVTNNPELTEPPVATATPAPTQVSPQPQLPQSKIYLLVLAALLVTVTAAAGYFYHQNNQLQSQLSSAEPEPNVEIPEEIVPSLDPTADWETYTNTYLGVSFRHQADWRVGAFAGDQSNFNKPVSELSEFKLDAGEISFHFQKPMFEGAFDLCYKKDSQQRALPASVQSLVYHSYTCDSKNLRIAYLVSEENNFSIVFEWEKGNASQEQLIDQILSTFRFTNAEQAADKNLKYSSKQVVNYMKPFTIYYPATWTISSEEGKNPERISYTLSKQSAKIIIEQGMMGGGGCLYPEDNQDQEGMFSHFGPYKTYNKGTTSWRSAQLLDTTGLQYGICELKNDGAYYNITSIGNVYFTAPSVDDQLIKEFEEIFDSIEIN